MPKRPVVAIDGPAGAGKSTVAKLLAADLSLRYLDTGAMYRALALKAVQLNLDPKAEAEAVEVLKETTIDFSRDDIHSILLDGEEVGGLIRTPEIGEVASSLSVHAVIRTWLVERQQSIVAEGGVILEGRDATTVIAPAADLKIFLTASLEERAKRRLEEFRTKGLAEDFQEVRNQIENRDHRDINRAESPLRVASDAVVVETGTRSVEDICKEIKRLLSEKLEIELNT